ncbi:MAG TPA: porin, partial [Chthonomonadaceae bacterium]|nr:porin [Chthonomonadaceae bacterium]
VGEVRDAVKAEAAKNTVTTSSGVTLRTGGTFHMWYIDAFGGTPNGNNPTNFSSAGPGRSFGGGAGDTFRIKRAEIFFTGQLLRGAPNRPGQADYFVLLDTAKTITNNSAGAPQPNSTMLQDAFVGYQIGTRWRFEIGQQKTDMDVEGSRSSAALWTIERSIMNLLPVNIGRVGYVRDVGAMVRYRGSKGSAMVGVFNGNGDSQSSVAGTRQHFADFNAYYSGIRHLTAGVWGGENVGDSMPAYKKERLGASLIYQNGQHVFEAEGAYTRDFSPASSSAGPVLPGTGSFGRGGYLLYGYAATSRFQMVGRFDVWDPSNQSVATPVGFSAGIPRQFHDLREYTLGINYYLNGRKADGLFDQRFKVQLNYIVDAVERNGVPFWGRSRNLLISNFQAAF